MRRGSWGAIFLVLVLLAPMVVADSNEFVSRVSLRDVGVLAEGDLGIRSGAVSPDGKDVLVAGMDGFARLISAEQADDRNKDVELVTGRSSTVLDVAWHPRGNTALLVGEDGMAMRYERSTHGITNVNGSFTVLGHQLTKVVWRPSGDFAYVGAADGTVWKFAEHTGFEPLDNTGNSPVTDLACHRNPQYNICFIASMDDGIAIVDKDHVVTWLPKTASHTWIGLDCADPTLNECFGFASGLKSGAIRINTIDARQSFAMSVSQFSLPSGEQIGIAKGHDSSTLVATAPLGMLRHEPLSNETFTVLMPEDAAEFDAVVAGRTLAMVWENGFHRGFFITNYGNVIAFEPAVVEVDTNIMTVLILGAVAVSVPGVLLGLTYMNSPWLQKKYNQWRFKKR